MSTSQIHGIRFMALAVVAIVMMLQYDASAKPSVDREDVITVATLMDDAVAKGDWCWTGGSDLEPDYVIFSRDGYPKISHKQKHIDAAIEQGVFNIDHNIDPGFAFCVADNN